MTDKELLELAAKAAGYGVNLLSEEPSGWYIYSGDERQKEFDTKYVWNPLTDDGDVARLESQCGISVSFGEEAVLSDFHIEYYEDHGGDKNKARRYASTKAAAEIEKE